VPTQPRTSPANLARQRSNASPTILDAVGQTPLVELSRLAEDTTPEGTRMLAKAEHLNPGGSCKDRLALALLDEVRQQADLAPGDPVVEATSGNTGIALAQACAIRGYELHVVASEKVSAEKIRILDALGARVHRTPKVAHDDPRHYKNRAPELAEELGGVYLDQFTSEANVRVHEEHTGRELVEQTRELGLEPDAFVAGVGTGGTLTGVARHLQRTCPAADIVLADPEGSVLADGGEAEGYLVEGIGDDHVPPLFEPALVDDAVTVTDGESFRHALLAARREGLLVGGSSGSHLAAAARVAEKLGPGAVVTTVLPDTGRNYLSTFLDQDWCRAQDIEDPWAGIPEGSP
jgi:cystathionine beta-synthase